MKDKKQRIHKLRQQQRKQAVELVLKQLSEQFHLRQSSKEQVNEGQ